MSLFKRKPKIIKGHTFSEYLSRCGREYIMGRGAIIKDPSKLKPNKRYWEINGEYYQINWKKEQQIGFIAVASIAILATIFLPVYFCVIAPMERYHDYHFKYWNNAPALNTLKEYVRNAVTPGNNDYVPKEDRIATFDMDGTLFGERSPIYLEWMLYNDFYDWLKVTHPEDTRLTSESEVPVKDVDPGGVTAIVTTKQVYDAINDFKETRVAEDIVVGGHKVTLEMAEAYLGAILFSRISVDDYNKMVTEYLENDAPCFNNLKTKDMFYKPMIEVVEFLQQNNFTVYVVSGTDRFMVRTIVNKHLVIPYNNVIGMDVTLEINEEDGQIYRTDNLIVKNVEEAKVYLITQEIGKRPILSFGNSNGDVDMHNFTIHNNKYKSLAFMVVANDLEREFGYTEEELEKRTETWGEFQKFYMKDDWKTIYGNNVTKK